MRRGLWVLGTLLGGLGAGSATGFAVPPDPEVDLFGFLDYVVAVTCAAPAAEAEALAQRLGAEPVLGNPGRIDPSGRMARRDERFRMPSDGELRIVRLAPAGHLLALAIELYRPGPGGELQPRAAALTDEDCDIELGRRIDYGADGQPQALVMLDRDLSETGERQPVDPPVPEGGDPGGVRVGLVDSGVNYTLPRIAGRLARDRAGNILGYDFWDMDRRPFDADTSRSPFFPARHGTQVASALIREAPTLSLVPYRYPRPALERMADLIEHAAANGIRVVNMALGSNRRDEWRAFAQAASAHPEILFVVSAGNDNRDIDRHPVYPAALELGNLIVITSSDAAGRLAFGSNWGARHVDLMVPGEHQVVFDFEGREQSASGTSFAVPRVTALAARLLAHHPGWSTDKLKEAILARARSSPHYAEQPVRHGWIPDPAGAR